MCEEVGAISADAIDSITTAIGHCKTDDSEYHAQPSRHLSKKSCGELSPSVVGSSNTFPQHYLEVSELDDLAVLKSQ